LCILRNQIRRPHWFAFQQHSQYIIPPLSPWIN
jgi:hypothetical protein